MHSTFQSLPILPQTPRTWTADAAGSWLCRSLGHSGQYSNVSSDRSMPELGNVLKDSDEGAKNKTMNWRQLQQDERKLN